MKKIEIANAALRQAGCRRVNDEVVAATVKELDDVIHCIGQDHLADLSPVSAELVEKLTKRLKK